MANFDIKINIRKIMEYSGSLDNSEDKKNLIKMIESFSEYIMNFYGRLIEESVNSNRYDGEWEPIEEEGYREYLGLVLKKSRILYLIRDSLECRKIGNNFIVRVDPKYKYPDTKHQFLKILRAIEHGTSDFNARPVLAKVAFSINHHILDLWRGYLMQKGVI